MGFEFSGFGRKPLTQTLSDSGYRGMPVVNIASNLTLGSKSLFLQQGERVAVDFSVKSEQGCLLFRLSDPFFGALLGDPYATSGGEAEGRTSVAAPSPGFYRFDVLPSGNCGQAMTPQEFSRRLQGRSRYELSYSASWHVEK